MLGSKLPHIIFRWVLNFLKEINPPTDVAAQLPPPYYHPT